MMSGLQHEKLGRIGRRIGKWMEVNKERLVTTRSTFSHYTSTDQASLHRMTSATWSIAIHCYSLLSIAAIAWCTQQGMWLGSMLLKGWTSKSRAFFLPCFMRLWTELYALSFKPKEIKSSLISKPDFANVSCTFWRGNNWYKYIQMITNDWDKKATGEPWLSISWRLAKQLAAWAARGQGQPLHLLPQLLQSLLATNSKQPWSTLFTKGLRSNVGFPEAPALRLCSKWSLKT